MSEKGIERQSTYSVFVVFCGYVLSVTAFLTGSRVGSALPAWQGVVAIFLGNMILAGYSGLIGLVGMKTGKSSAVNFQPVFGTYGQIITSTLVTLFVINFISIYGAMIAGLLQSFFPWFPAWLAITIFIGIIALTNFTGFKGLSLLGKIAVPAILIFMVYGLIMVGTKVGFVGVFEAQPIAPQSMLSMVSMVAASWMTGSTFSSDITRFTKKPFYVFLVTVVSFIAVTALESTGLFCSLGTGEGDIVKILGALGMQAVALVIYFALALSSGQAIVYTFSLALASISRVITKNEETKLNERFWIIPGCIYAIAVGCYMYYNGVMASFQSFIGTVGIFIPSIGGVLVSHFFLVERDFQRPFLNMPKIRWLAYAAWGCGVAAAQFLKFGIQTLNGFLVAIVAYAALRYLFDKPVRSEATASAQPE